MARKHKKQRGVFERVKKSGVWWIRYSDQYGKIHIEKVGLRQTAVNIYNQRKTEILQEKFEPELARRRKNICMAELIKDRETEAKGLKGYKSNRTFLKYWLEQLGSKPARSILPADIEAKRQELAASGLEPASVNRYTAEIRRVFSLAMENEKAEKNPVSKIAFTKENNKRVRYLSDEEEIQLFKVLPIKYHALLIVAMNTGLRKTEQLSLQWSDIDFKREQITVRDSKSGKPRFIPMSNTVLECLKNLSKIRLIDNPYVFPGDNKAERQKDLPHYWEEYLKQAGIEDFHWHDLRHTFASRLVMGGVDLYSVSTLLGHHSLEMTKRYSHLSPDYLKGAVNVLDKPVQTATKTATGEGEFVAVSAK